MMRNFELQRDKEFTLHVCADHPRTKSQGARTLNNSNCRMSERGGQSARSVKQDWEKLYRAAVLESDRSKLLQRIKDAEAAIRERSRSYQSRQATMEKSRMLSLGHCTS